MTTHFDIIIVGAGLTGATLALGLSHKNLRIALIDSSDPLSVRDKPFLDCRSIALSYVSQQIFSALGLWSHLEPIAAPIRAIHISDKGYFGRVQFNAKDLDVPALGYVVELEKIQGLLYQKLFQQTDMTVLTPAVVTKVLHQADRYTVYIQKKDNTELTFTTDLLVGADGTHSTVRKLVDIATQVYHYQQSALVTTVALARSHLDTAFERFAGTGPIALLPLTKQRAAVVWTLPTSKAEALLKVSPQAFLNSLQQSFGYRCGKLLQVGTRQCFVLTRLQAKEIIRKNLVLVGNACQTLHPIAAQGFNLGLRDVAYLIQLIVENIKQGKPCGDFARLQTYQQQRRQDQQATSQFTHDLLRIFSQDFLAFNFVRALGLAGLDCLPPIKHILARKKMGFVAKLPDIALGIQDDYHA